ncbi:ATP-dependent DNA ligase [Synechococcus sp. UW179B]|uniref:ATP-dependent DNA ligase n=1 Tax=Synechococcus sp. UW179B TaxID=2575516 RepID=UPI000E0ED640|nr:ATP-dependent DNA ligase [Synechococcus sp. UW179B]
MKPTSLKQFGDLIAQLDQCNGTNKKIQTIADFIKDIDPRDGSWTISLLIGNRQRRLITGRKLRDILQTRTKMPSWLFDDCFAQVGDSAETISLLWPQIRDEIANTSAEPCNNSDFVQLLHVDHNKPLHWWMEKVLPVIKDLPDRQQNDVMIMLWQKTPEKGHYLINNLITGGFRIGVSKGIVVKSIAQAYELNESIIIERLMQTIEVTKEWFEQLTKPQELNQGDRGAIPYPFYLASPVQLIKIKETAVDDWRLECKWDGIRGQLIRRESGSYLWSRGEELINSAFPEIIKMADKLPLGTVLDGEIICWREGEGKPMTFGSLQKRLGRKTVSKSLLSEYPAKFLAYDLLEFNTIDLRSNELTNRVSMLDMLSKQLNNDALMISESKDIHSWNQLDELRQQAGQEGAEGLMIKKLNSPYLSGRKKGSWWKYKHEPMTLDAVLIYAQAGTGKRANLFTDYTFALWDKSEMSGEARKLVTFAKAHSGLDNNEILALDRWIRTHTKDRFGPTRVVEEKQVFEIAFEGVLESKRHKCGLAVRFPRIHRWRTDKSIDDADCIERAQAFCRKD